MSGNTRYGRGTTSTKYNFFVRSVVVFVVFPKEEQYVRLLTNFSKKLTYKSDHFFTKVNVFSDW